LYGQICRL